MLARTGLDAQEALICTMVLVAAADGRMTDREIGVMAGQVQTLPVFHNFSSDRLDAATDAAVNLLNEEDGLNHAARLIRDTEMTGERLFAAVVELAGASGELARMGEAARRFAKPGAAQRAADVLEQVGNK